MEYVIYAPSSGHWSGPYASEAEARAVLPRESRLAGLDLRVAPHLSDDLYREARRQLADAGARDGVDAERLVASIDPTVTTDLAVAIRWVARETRGWGAE
jgi:hypothetical protein